MKKVEANIITMEKAIEQGLGSVEIRNASLWHREKARLCDSEHKERHYLFAAKLLALSERMERKGV